MDFIGSALKKVSLILKKYMEKHNLSFSFLGNPIIQRWIIAISLCLALSIIIAPEIHFSAAKYKIGMICTKDIKADRDFLVEDQVSTRQKKIDAGENVKSIYDYDNNIAVNIKEKLAKTFHSLTEFHQDISREKPVEYSSPNIQETQKLKKIIETNLGIPLETEEYYIFNEQKYSAKLPQKFYRLVISFYESRYITNAFFTKGEKEKGIILKNLKTQNEEDLKDINQVLNMKDIDTALWKRVNATFSKSDQDLRRVAFSISKKLIEPNLTFNKEATEKKKLTAIEDVKPVFFQVQKNEMIVREGEKLGQMEVSKLDAFFKATGDNKFSSIAVVLGIFFTTLFLSMVLYFWRTRNWLKVNNRSNIDLLVFGLVTLLQIVFVKIGIFMSSAVNRAFPFLSIESCYYAIPFAMGAMIIAILINRNVALIISVLTAFLIGFLFDEKIIFPLYSFLF